MTFAQAITEVFTTSFIRIGDFLPQFIGGLLILLVGLIVATILKHALEVIFKVIKLDAIAESANLAKGKSIRVWTEFLGELVRWAVIIAFLVPTVEAWGITRITDILNELLLYIPNVFVAVVVGFVGFIIANLASTAVSHGVKGLGASSAGVLATVARYALLFFTALIVLHQLGVAADLIQILFTGIIAMLSLAGGLAFGLGGQDTARDVLHDLRKRLEQK